MRQAPGLLIFAMVCVPSLARAQEDPARRELIARATQARDRGDHARALTLARDAAARRMSPSLRTFIAQEEAALGRLTEALGDARQCVREVEADASLANRDTLLRECRTLVTTLSARAAPPEPRPAPVATSPAPPPAEVRSPASLRAVAAPEATPRSGPGAAPWIVVGLGVVSFAASGVFYSLRQDALGERDAQCGGTAGPCDLTTSAAVDAAQTSQDRANTYNLLTNVAIGVGGAAVAGGLLWYLLGRSGSNDPPRTALVVTPAAGGVWLGLRGSL